MPTRRPLWLASSVSTSIPPQRAGRPRRRMPTSREDMPKRPSSHDCLRSTFQTPRRPDIPVMIWREPLLISPRDRPELRSSRPLAIPKTFKSLRTWPIGSAVFVPVVPRSTGSTAPWERGQARALASWCQGPIGGIVRFYQGEWIASHPRRSGWESYFIGGRTPTCNPGSALLVESKRFAPSGQGLSRNCRPGSRCSRRPSIRARSWAVNTTAGCSRRHSATRAIASSGPDRPTNRAGRLAVWKGAIRPSRGGPSAVLKRSPSIRRWGRCILVWASTRSTAEPRESTGGSRTVHPSTTGRPRSPS